MTLFIYEIFHINIFLLFIIFLTIINVLKGKYITIPFKVVYNNEPETFSNFIDYYNSWHEISFYGDISVGTPPNKIITKLTFEDYGISILNKGCDYNISSKDINLTLNLKNDSSSFNQSYDFYYGYEQFYYKSFNDAFYAKDIFYFNSTNYKKEELNDIIKTDNLTFIYSPHDNKKTSTCFNIGFKAFCRNLRETSLNIIFQLKKYSIINNYDWSIIFDNGQLYPDKGLFLIGAKPHEYNPELFNEKDIFGSGSISDEVIPYFNFKINEIYFDLIDKSEKIDVTNTEQLDTLQLIPTYGLIKGSQNYEKNIEKYFFDDFIKDNKCYKEYKDQNNIKSFRTFVCYNKGDIKEELRKKFPILKFKHRGFVYTFELNYDDLFKEKGDKIYFLMWFNSNIDTGWELGYPFCKKYVFNYNYDEKSVYFYNKIENDKENNNNYKKRLVISIVIIIGLIIIALVLGFFIGMFFKKKKKSIAQELDSESLFVENETQP